MSPELWAVAAPRGHEECVAMAAAAAAFKAHGFGASPNELAMAVAAAVLNCGAWIQEVAKPAQAGEATWAVDTAHKTSAAEEVGIGISIWEVAEGLNALVCDARDISDSTEFSTADE